MSPTSTPRVADRSGTASLENGIDLAWESFGDPEDPTVLLVMGLGASMLFWPADFCGELADRGFHVIRYDNRDCGRSTTFSPDISRATLIKTFLGAQKQAPYSISDLAADAVALLGRFDVPRAHIVGMSMGGMIAQTVAVEHPDVTLTLTSISSTTGNRRVGGQHPKLFPKLLVGAGTTREEYIEHVVRMTPTTGSPGYLRSTADTRAFAAACWDHGVNRAGTVRQMTAVLTQPDRTALLRRLTVPTLVIHGAADTMVMPSGGRATADAVPASNYLVIPGMGHDLPRALWPILVPAIAGHCAGERV